jgi:hypothetical protein
MQGTEANQVLTPSQWRGIVATPRAHAAQAQVPAAFPHGHLP